MKKFEMRDVMYFGLYVVAFILLALNAIHAGKERKAYKEKMDVIEAKLDALASSTDALGIRIDEVEASNTDAIQDVRDSIIDVQEQMQEEIKKINDKIKEVEEAKAEKKRQAEEAAAYAASTSYTAEQSSGYDHPFRSQGVTSDGAYKYTWYSQRALAGEGLSIPDRHVNEDGFVVDGDGNLCVALDNVPMGTEIDTPFGKAKVYDRVSPDGSSGGVIDVYTDW